MEALGGEDAACQAAGAPEQRVPDCPPRAENCCFLKGPRAHLSEQMKDRDLTRHPTAARVPVLDARG